MSDQCLARRLVTDSTYSKVLESGETSEDKARTLILAVRKCTETNSSCLEIFLDVLDQQLPYLIKSKLLSDIRKRLNKTDDTTVIPLVQSLQLVPTKELPRESAVQHRILLDKFEDATRQHEQEKKLLEN